MPMAGENSCHEIKEYSKYMATKLKNILSMWPATERESGVKSFLELSGPEWGRVRQPGRAGTSFARTLLTGHSLQRACVE